MDKLILQEAKNKKVNQQFSDFTVRLQHMFTGIDNTT